MSVTNLPFLVGQTALGGESAIYTETTDAPYNWQTTYTIAVGDTFNGTLSSNADQDGIKLAVAAGDTYRINVFATNGSALDPTLSIFSPSNDYVTFDDNSGAGTGSSMLLSFATSGTYFLDVESSGSASLGDYSVTVASRTPLATYSDDQIASQLSDGYWTSSGRSARHFAINAGGALDVNITALTADGQTLATTALQAWTYVTGITFNLVTTGGKITFDDTVAGAFSDSVTSGTTIVSSTVNVSTQWLIDNGTTLDSYGFQTYIHEIGHALGLGHSGNYNGSANYGNDNSYTNDSFQQSIMSYFDQINNTAVDASLATVITPMMADIIAIKSMYGAASGQRVGDTTYGDHSNAGGYYDALSTLTAPIAFTIVDDGGTDTLDFGTGTASQTINLTAETFSSVGGLNGNMGIARGTVIENAISGSGNDVLIGNDVANVIHAGAGNDTLSGGLGDDTLDGGLGIDTVTYGAATGGVSVYLKWGNVRGADGNDHLVSIENATGSAFADRVIGDGGANTLYGGAGNDILKSKGGGDSLYGGAGQDRLVGGALADTMDGGAGGDTVSGAGGNDIIQGGAGADYLYGNGGNDTIHAGADNDKVMGGQGDDLLYGDSGVNRLYGGRGNDTLTAGSGGDYLRGEAGIDTLVSGVGNDRLFGGTSSDTFVFAPAGGYDRIGDWQAGLDIIDLRSFALTSFADVQAIAVDFSAGVRLDFSDGSMLLIEHETAAALVASEFML